MKRSSIRAPRSGSPPPLRLNNLACNDKGDADAGPPRESSEEDIPQSEPLDSEEDNGADPAHAGVSDRFSEYEPSEPKLPSSPEHPSCDTGTNPLFSSTSQ